MSMNFPLETFAIKWQLSFVFWLEINFIILEWKPTSCGQLITIFANFVSIDHISLQATFHVILQFFSENVKHFAYNVLNK